MKTKDTTVTTIADILALPDTAIVKRRQVEQALSLCNITVLRMIKDGTLDARKTGEARNAMFLIKAGSVKAFIRGGK